MGRLLFLLFTAVPLLDLWLLVQLGGRVGALPTLLAVLATGLLGAVLAKREGRRVLEGYRRALAEGRAPEEGLLGGALVLAGGVLLVSPGVLTDVAGLLLLLPPTRALAARALRRRLEAGVRSGRVAVFHMGGRTPAPGAPGPWGPTAPRAAPTASRRSPASGAGRGAREEAEVVEEAPGAQPHAAGALPRREG
jgi:UPF0716 protein FxsA